MTTPRSGDSRPFMTTGFWAIVAATGLAGSLPQTTLAGQETTTKKSPAAEARPEDVASVDAIVASLYETISGPAGPRDWDRLRSLFLPGARLIPCRRQADGSSLARVLTVEEFIAAVEPRTKDEGFFESEIHRRVERFGAIAQIFSTYESRHAKNDPKPFVRGINSFQLFYDGKRWWVVTIFWDSERSDQPIPTEFLPTKP